MPDKRDRFSEGDLHRFRADTRGCRERIHLNNAGAALMPRPVSQAVIDHIDLETRIGGYEAAAARADAVRDAYAAIADLLGCTSRNIAFVENATAAYAQALSAVPFERGDTILTSTDDYVSNQLMFLSLARRYGVRVVRTPNAPEGGVDLDAIREVLGRARPRVVALTHVPTSSGLVQPIERVGEICRERNVLYLVDACQSVGQRPIDVGAIGCDFLSATSRKFLRGPRGSGFLYVADRVLESDLAPLFVDLHGATWTGSDTYVPKNTAARFENWEFAYALVLGTGVAARYAKAVGLERIALRTTALAERMREALGAVGLRVLDRGPELCAIVTVAIPMWEADAFHARLESRGINTSVSTRAYAVIDFAEKRVDWALRLSPHYYNTEAEITSAVAAIGELTAERRVRTE